MAKLDSVKIKAPETTITNLYLDVFDREKKVSSDGEIIKDRYILNKNKTLNTVGIKAIEVNRTSQEILLELSAKVLKDQYYKLINENTIEECLGNVNQSNAIKLNVNNFIDSAEVLRCDVTTNLQITKNINDYLNILNCLRQNNRYRVDQHKGSIVFTHTGKTVRKRMTFYDKYRELNEHKNKEFVELIKPATVTQFKNVLRCEQNISKHKDIRDRLGIKNITLGEVLRSKVNANFDLFSEIRDTNGQLELFSNRYEGMRLSEMEKRLGRENIIKQCNYDIQLIKQFLSFKLSNGNKDLYYYLNNHYKPLLFEMRTNNTDTELQLLEEIKGLLLVA